MASSEIIKNLAIIVSTVLISVGLVILYFAIYFAVRKINEINEKIEDNHKSLNKKQIEKIDGDMEFNIKNRSKKENQQVKQIELKIEELQRKKEYILEKISIYKIFKK